MTEEQRARLENQTQEVSGQELERVARAVPRAAWWRKLWLSYIDSLLRSRLCQSRTLAPATTKTSNHSLKSEDQPWLVWLSGLSAGLWTKGWGFDSQWGHMPGLQARSPVGDTWETIIHWCFSPSLCPSVPFCLKTNKQTKEWRSQAGTSSWLSLGHLPTSWLPGRGHVASFDFCRPSRWRISPK